MQCEHSETRCQSRFLSSPEPDALIVPALVIQQQRQNRYRYGQCENDSETAGQKQPSRDCDIQNGGCDCSIITRSALVGNTQRSCYESGCDNKKDPRANAAEQDGENRLQIHQICGNQQCLRQMRVDPLEPSHSLSLPVAIGVSYLIQLSRLCRHD